MVVANQEALPSNRLNAVHMAEGLEVTLQANRTFFKGFVHFEETGTEQFVVMPRLNMYNEPMGDPIPVPWEAMAGEGAEVKVFRR